MPDKYFVIDTNIVISVAVFSSLNPALCLKRMAFTGSFAFSEPVLQEYAETLSNSKFDKYLSLEKRLYFLEKLIAEGTLIEVTEHIQACRDPKDDKYLALAVACNAFCILTGDKDLLVLHPFRNVPIWTPNDFLNQY
jgi:putative PIN family toxin of toxin-antitoxin system